jgi:hypothetical protein
MQLLYNKSKMPENTKILFREKNIGEYKFDEKLHPGDVKLIQIYNI